MTRSGTYLTHQEELLQTMATTYPNVRVFLDKLKVLTGVLERQKGQDGGGGGGGEEEEDLKCWLEREGDDLEPLALKPIRSSRELHRCCLYRTPTRLAQMMILPPHLGMTPRAALMGQILRPKASSVKIHAAYSFPQKPCVETRGLDAATALTLKVNRPWL
jgi:hypothetical protein